MNVGVSNDCITFLSASIVVLKKRRHLASLASFMRIRAASLRKGRISKSFLLMIAIVPGAAAMVQAEPVSQAQIISTEVSPEVISMPIPYFRNICMR